MSVTVLFIGAGVLWALLMGARMVRSLKTAGRLVRLWIAVWSLGAAAALSLLCLVGQDALADSLGVLRFAVWALAAALVWLGVRCGLRPLFSN